MKQLKLLLPASQKSAKLDHWLAPRPRVLLCWHGSASQVWSAQWNRIKCYTETRKMCEHLTMRFELIINSEREARRRLYGKIFFSSNVAAILHSIWRDKATVKLKSLAWLTKFASIFFAIFFLQNVPKTQMTRVSKREKSYVFSLYSPYCESKSNEKCFFKL
jgi:hypothetical protein